MNQYDDLLSGLDPASSELPVLSPSPVLDRFPPPPDDGYDWSIFAGDQQARPYLFHGTSAAYHTSLDRHGIDFKHVPYDAEQIASITALCAQRGVETSGIARRALAAFTTNTVLEQTVSLTFDWYRAIRYAARSPGGETVDCLLELLAACLNDHRLAFTAEEHASLRAVYEDLHKLLTRHRPLVAIVELDLDWLASETRAYFVDRAAFLQSENSSSFLAPGALIRGFVGRRLSIPGVEVVTHRVPRDAIQELRVLNLDADQIRLLRPG
jgi:hypothetical protein